MILLTYGTRPEYIKIKPLIKEFKNEKVPFKILFTGQHKDIANGDYDFKIEMSDLSENRLDSVIANIMTLKNDVFEGITHILVQGDTTSVVGLSLSALHRKIKVIHLEAGLRTYNNQNPFPEENNRKIVSTIASIHLCPTETNANNLYKENINENVFIVGNTVLDNLIDFKEKCEYKNKVLVTIHRRENHENIIEWFNVINDIAKNYNEIEFILPIHPNPNIQKYKSILTNVNVVEPLNHTELISLLVETKLVITDSGGIQEEASFLKIPVLVARNETERMEGIYSGCAKLVGLDSLRIIGEAKKLLDSEEMIISMKNILCPYGDGYAVEKIIQILQERSFI
jgi:UDP-N-acetylglucosamine 2-epimerase (non-hydrolysing)